MATNDVLLLVVVLVVISTKTFLFRNRSSLNLTRRLLMITFTIFAPWRIFNLSPRLTTND